MEWLDSKGFGVCYPIGHSPDYDLIADDGEQLIRVQVKTSTQYGNRRWRVAICTRGGNQSWSGLVKRFDTSRCDRLFVLVADGRRWFIPASAVEATTAVHLGGPKYAEFEVESGRPLPVWPWRDRYARRSPAGFPSGQRGRAVNALALPSQVRILPPP